MPFYTDAYINNDKYLLENECVDKNLLMFSGDK